MLDSVMFLPPWMKQKKEWDNTIKIEFMFANFKFSSSIMLAACLLLGIGGCWLLRGKGKDVVGL